MLTRVGPYLVESGDVATQADVDSALDSLIHDSFATQADPAHISALVSE